MIAGRRADRRRTRSRVCGGALVGLLAIGGLTGEPDAAAHAHTAAPDAEVPDAEPHRAEPRGVDQDRVRPPRVDPGRVRPRRPSRQPDRVQPDRVAPPGAQRDDGRPAGAVGDALEAGFTRLARRLGDAAPTGRGVTVAMVEAPENGRGWVPDRQRPDMRSITFLGPVDGRGAPLSDSPVSRHATATAERFFGSSPVAASGISTVHILRAADFLAGGWLRGGERALPHTLADVRVVANAWVGNGGTSTNELLARLDVLLARDGVVFVAGLNNSAPDMPLMTGAWNVLGVGTVREGHVGSNLGPRAVGSGKPRIVAPGGTTSAATPVVASAAAVLMETADRIENPAIRRLAARPETVIAVLLASADRVNEYRGTWTDAPVLAGPDRGRNGSPLDSSVGAGTLDVDAAQRILATPPVNPGARMSGDGWTILPPAQDEQRWLLEVTEPVDLVAVLQWFRGPVTPVPAADGDGEGEERRGGLRLADLSLELVAREPSDEGRLVDRPLVGRDPDAAGANFRAGSVASDAAESSVEGLRVRGLQPGRYALVARRDGTGDGRPLASLAWIVRPSGDAGEVRGAAPERATPPQRIPPP